MVKWGLTSALVLVVVAVPLAQQSGAPASFVGSVQDRIRNRLEAGAAADSTLGIRGERIHARVTLPAFYEQRAHAPGWIGDAGFQPTARALVEALRRAGEEGLRPEDYHLEALESVLREADAGRLARNDVPAWAAADLLFTDAFLIYGSHLLSGRVNPETFDAEWRANRREGDMAAVLTEALAANRVGAALAELLPAHPGYARLKRALGRYRVLDDWPTVPAGPSLRSGDTGPRVRALADRLVASGDLDAAAASGDVFGDALETAVRRFQRRLGLQADGVVGAGTLSALNVSRENRVEQIRLNLERWRWLPQDLGRRHILVNIPSFELRLVEDGQVTMEMRVIVGRDYRRTPVFSGRMTYLVLNPYWHVTRSIATQDKLPLIQKDPGYLAAQKMRVFEEGSVGRREVDPATINWAALSRQNFPYQLRQDPGPLNALGQVKFMFPNEHNVYLHDTPARELFSQTTRSFSSGCIRLQRPVELAAAVLRGTSWTREVIDQTLATRQDVAVTLPDPVMVHLEYWTAWADADDAVEFRTDLYGRDQLLAAGLAGRAPRR